MRGSVCIVLWLSLPLSFILGLVPSWYSLGTTIPSICHILNPNGKVILASSISTVAASLYLKSWKYYIFALPLPRSTSIWSPKPKVQIGGRSYKWLLRYSIFNILSSSFIVVCLRLKTIRLSLRFLFDNLILKL